MSSHAHKQSSSYFLYLSLIVGVFALSYIARSFPALHHFFSEAPEGFYLALALIFALGYLLNYFSPRTIIPSFVWAIFFGMALQPLLVLLTHDPKSLSFIVEILAALVLFGGGVEVPFKNFKKYFGPIASLSIAGTVLTVLFFSLALEYLGKLHGVDLPAEVFLITAAILASIDPTAIIPSLKMLHFKRPFLRDIAVSESALNDVTGTILTRFIIIIALAGVTYSSVGEIFGVLTSREVFDSLALEVVWGILVGVIGAYVLKKWSKTLEAKESHSAGDPALFFAVPILAFAVGSIVGGSGFLATFVAGLLFDGTSPTKSVRHFFEAFGDGFIKPVIFILLGAVVPLPALLATAGIGVVSALIFMFVIRPVVVLISLAPWWLGKKGMFSLKEIVFMSFVRETGAIPAVLILVAVASGIAGSEFIFSIGMWVILLTLIIEPPLTPVVARVLGLTRDEAPESDVKKLPITKQTVQTSLKPAPRSKKPSTTARRKTTPSTKKPPTKRAPKAEAKKRSPRKKSAT